MNGTSLAVVDTNPRNSPLGPSSWRMALRTRSVDVFGVVCNRVVSTSRGSFASEDTRSPQTAARAEAGTGANWGTHDGTGEELGLDGGKCNRKDLTCSYVARRKAPCGAAPMKLAANP